MTSDARVDDKLLNKAFGIDIDYRATPEVPYVPIDWDAILPKVERFRKKPVEIEAMRMPNGDEDYLNAKAMEVYRWIEDNTLGSFDPDGPTPSSGVTIDPGTGKMQIATLEGRMFIDLGDYVIRGIKGEFYPCKPDIFEGSYDVSGGEDFPEWVLIREGLWSDGEPPIWAHRDNPHLFSLDEGKTYYDTTEPLRPDGSPTMKEFHA